MDVLTVTPPTARLKGPASAFQLIGITCLAGEVLGMHTLFIIAPDDSSPIVTLSVPQQITQAHANQLTDGMPVYLVGEDQRPLRSENMNRTFADLCGVVDKGRLLLTCSHSSGASFN